MVRLDWDNAFRAYEAGIDRGVLYFGEEAITWEGLVSVTEEAPVSDLTPLYFEGLIANFSQQLEDYSATIEAFVYPYILDDVILALTDTRTLVSTVKDDDMPFGFTYRTTGNDGSYKIHIIYNVISVVEIITRATIDDSLDLEPFVFKFYTTPIDVPGCRPTAHFVLDTAVASPSVVFRVEEILYGTPIFNPRLPAISELIELIAGTPSTLPTPEGSSSGSTIYDGSAYGTNIVIVDGGTVSTPGLDVVNGGSPTLTTSDIIDGGST